MAKNRQIDPSKYSKNKDIQPESGLSVFYLLFEWD